jgi:hypothetical protein
VRPYKSFLATALFNLAEQLQFIKVYKVGGFVVECGAENISPNRQREVNCRTMAVSSAGKPTDKSVAKIEFDPTNYLEKSGNQAHLPLKWQLVWLRSDFPEAKIRTKLVNHEGGTAIFQAEIELPNGALATGWGAETQSYDGEFNRQDLSYLTAAENMALTRALFMLGYGTEYAHDFDPPADIIPIILSADNSLGLEDDLAETANIEVPLDPMLEEDEEEETEPNPTSPNGNTRSRLGEVKVMYESAPRLRPLPRPEEEEIEQETPPLPLPLREKAPEVPTAPQLVSPEVEERLRGIEDSHFRLLIKQIYSEANGRHKIAPDMVDKRSQERYGKPTFELSSDEAQEFLERIMNSRPRGSR